MVNLTLKEKCSYNYYYLYKLGCNINKYQYLH